MSSQREESLRESALALDSDGFPTFPRFPRVCCVSPQPSPGSALARLARDLICSCSTQDPGDCSVSRARLLKGVGVSRGMRLPFSDDFRMTDFRNVARSIKNKRRLDFSRRLAGRANGIRTRVTAVKGRCMTLYDPSGTCEQLCKYMKNKKQAIRRVLCGS